MTYQKPQIHMAIECLWLKRSLDSSRRDPYAMCCTHIVREGEECIGPFLEDIETPCGLWERGPAGSRARRVAPGRG